MIGTKTCTKCGEMKALEEYAICKRGRLGRRSRCKVCEMEEWKKLPRRDVSVTEKECGKCHEVKPATGFTRNRRCKTGLDSTCRECRRKVRENRTPEQRARQLKQQKAYNQRWRRDIDRTRKIMSQANQPLTTEEAREAYVRGFFKGRSVQEAESTLITDNQDLVFRIASQVYDPNHPDQGSSYEDCVGYAYEGILDAARKYRPNNRAGASFRAFAAQRIRGAVLDALRERGSRWMISPRNRSYAAAAPMTGKDADGVAKNLVEILPAGSCPDTQVVETEAKLDSEALFARIESEIDSRHAYVVRRCYEGITLSKIGEELGVTESRASQMRIQVRKWAASIGLGKDPVPSE